MKCRVLTLVGCAAAVAFAQPATYLAQSAGRAADVLARARNAIGGGRLDTLKTFAVTSDVRRNLPTVQIDSDVEIYLELPDKYARVESRSGGPGMVVSSGGTTGFNGDRPLRGADTNGVPAGAMMIRIDPGGAPPPSRAEKPTPEQLAQMHATMLRSARLEASRLMLGWFAMAHPAANAEYAYAGEAESPDGKAYVVDVRNADGLAARLFVDEQTNLPLMVTYQAPQPRVVTRRRAMATGEGQSAAAETPQPPAMADYTIYFEGWRDAGGVKFPFKIRRATGGTTIEEWTVSKARLNPKIDAKTFAVDGGQ